MTTPFSVSSDSVCESGTEWAKSYAKEKKVIFTYMIPFPLMVGPLVLGRTKQTNTLALHHLLMRQRHIKRCKIYSLSSSELQEKLKYRKWVWNMYKYLLVTSTVLCASWLNMNRIPGVEAWELFFSDKLGIQWELLLLWCSYAAQMERPYYSRRARSCVSTWSLLIPTQRVSSDILGDRWLEEKHTEKKKQGLLCGYMEQAEMNSFVHAI